MIDAVNSNCARLRFSFGTELAGLHLKDFPADRLGEQSGLASKHCCTLRKMLFDEQKKLFLQFDKLTEKKQFNK